MLSPRQRREHVAESRSTCLRGCAAKACHPPVATLAQPALVPKRHAKRRGSWRGLKHRPWGRHRLDRRFQQRRLANIATAVAAPVAAAISGIRRTRSIRQALHIVSAPAVVRDRSEHQRRMVTRSAAIAKALAEIAGQVEIANRRSRRGDQRDDEQRGGDRSAQPQRTNRHGKFLAGRCGGKGASSY